MVAPVDLERFRTAVHFERVRTLELELAELKFRLSEIPYEAVQEALRLYREAIEAVRAAS